MIMPSQTCPLCGHQAPYYRQFKTRTYYQCPHCQGTFLSREALLDQEREKARYDLHNNDPRDPHYRAFLMPLVEAVTRDFPPEAQGLDYGSGPFPSLSLLLGDQGYQVASYDPYYAKNPRLLEVAYDYIVACEVVEHFYRPIEDFKRLRALLKKGGRIYIKTALLDPSIDFDTWYYKNDATHVFFYKKETLAWVQEALGFSLLEFHKDYILLG